jgi:hypothetical protein
MKKIYTLVIVSKAVQREAKLGSLLSDSDEVLDIPFEYIWTKNGKLQKEISFKIKTYKTLGGANKECVKINSIYSDKSMKLSSGTYIDRRWVQSFNFDTSQYAFVVIDITTKWNLHIEKEISKETLKHNRIIIELLKLRV